MGLYLATSSDEDTDKDSVPAQMSSSIGANSDLCWLMLAGDTGYEVPVVVKDGNRPRMVCNPCSTVLDNW